MNKNERIRELAREAATRRILALREEIVELEAIVGPLDTSEVKGKAHSKPKRRLSAQARANISKARKAYYARLRAEKAGGKAADIVAAQVNAVAFPESEVSNG
jgi:hypothetical protein